MRLMFTFILLLFCATVFSQAGAFDKSFGVNGKFISQDVSVPNVNYGASAVAVQPDGKIILAGYGNTFAANGSQDFSILRLNVDGTVDKSFGSSGRVFIDFTNTGEAAGFSSDVVNAIALQPDGKIVVAGTTTIVNPAPDSIYTVNESDIFVARLNTNGSLDVTFNATGKKRIDLSSLTRHVSGFNYSYDMCNGVIIRLDGKIVLGGYVLNNKTNTNNDDYDALLIQLNTNGSIDSSFQNTGVEILPKDNSGEKITGMALQSDGKVVLEGYTNASNSSLTKRNVLLIRTTASGTLDSTFNGNGFSIASVSSNADNTANAVAIQNGKIVVAGTLYGDNFQNSFLVRFNADGTLDTGFGSGGKTIFSRDGETNNTANAIAIQKDGKIVIVGSQISGDYIGANGQVIRYKTTGTLDSTFGTNGRSNLIDVSGSAAVALQQDGKIIVAGSTPFPTNYRGVLVSTELAYRLLPSGRNYGLVGPKSVTANLINQCTASFSNLAPTLYPDTSLTAIRYRLYTNYDAPAFDSGVGCVDGKEFGLGKTYVEYYSIIDSNQRAYFTVTVNDAPATALDFDGVDDRIDLTGINNSYVPVVSSNHTYSFEAWLKVKGYNQKEGGYGSVIFGNERNGDSGVIVSLDTTGFITTYQPNVGRVTSSYQIPLNTWTYIAFVQSPAKLDLYVNGGFIQTLLTAPNLHAATSNLYYIGAYTDDGVYFSRHFNGVIDNLRIWNTALCEAQMQNNYHCHIPDGPYTLGLVAELTFNQGNTSCNNANLNYALCKAGAYSNVSLGTLKNFSLNGTTSNWIADSSFVNGICSTFKPLTISSHDNISLFAQNGLCGAVANFAVTTNSQCSDSVAISYSKNPGTVFPVGETYVTATANDILGNSTFTNFYVSVIDTVPPSLTTKDTTVRLDKNGSASIVPTSVVASLTDNCSSQSAPRLTVSPTSFTTTGAYTVIVTAQDTYNNATTKNATVTVLSYDDGADRNGINNLTVVASPNPSQSQFTVTVQNSDPLQKMSVTISDAEGRVLETFSNVTAGEVIRLGAKYKAGIYLVEVKAGTTRKTYKLIKF